MQSIGELDPPWIKLKSDIELEHLESYGFKRKGNDYIATIGALDIYCNTDTRKITGYGFYPVGDRIVMRELEELGMSEIVTIAKAEKKE